jgi:hypothetical protein
MKKSEARFIVVVLPRQIYPYPRVQSSDKKESRIERKSIMVQAVLGVDKVIPVHNIFKNLSVANESKVFRN